MRTRKCQHFPAVACLIALGLSFLPVAQSQESSVAPPATRTVTGTDIGHYPNGPLPVDLSTTTVAAYVPGAGGYNVISGTGTSAGTFTISNVPAGFYVLQLGSTFLVTSNSTVDADFSWGFRSNGVAANSNTQLTFDLTNLDAWQSTDVFEMVCPNNSAFLEENGTVGETTFAGTFPYDEFGIQENLSDGSKGDQYFILQLSTQTVGGFPFTAAARAFFPPKFTQAQGSDTLIGGALATVAQNQQFEANINGADLSAQAIAANPGAKLVGTGLVLDAYPGSVANGERTSTPDLVAYNLSYFAAGPLLTSNMDLGTISYGNPFPANFPLFVLYAWNAQTMYTAPGATSSMPLLTFEDGYNTALPTVTNPVKPLVGVVTHPSINGHSLFANQIGVGVTPTLKWSPPAVGTATFYDVEIIQLTNEGGSTVETGFTSVRTSATTLTIPPGLLSKGNGYVFVVRSWYVPGLNFAKTPFMSGPVSAFTDLSSGLMQP